METINQKALNFTAPNLNDEYKVNINLFPAKFISQEAHVYVGKYNENLLRQLQNKVSNGIVWRDPVNGERLYVWFYNSQTTFNEPGFKKVRESLNSNVRLFCDLLLQGVAVHLKKQGYIHLPDNRGNNWCFSNYQDANLIPWDKFQGGDNRIGVYPKIILKTFITSSQSINPFVGLVVNTGISNRLDVPISELTESGINCIGRYVKLNLGDSQDTNLQQYNGLVIGKLIEIKGNKLVLDDFRHPSLYEVNANWCYLEANKTNLDFVLQTRYGMYYNQIQETITQKIKVLTTPAGKQSLIKRIISDRLHISNPPTPISLGAGVSITFEAMIKSAQKNVDFPLSSINLPAFSFDPDSVKIADFADAGLKRYGPYTQSTFRNRNFRILVISPDTFKGQVEIFLQNFLLGIKGFTGVYSGFCNKYKISSSQIQIERNYFPFTTSAPRINHKNAYLEACRRSIEVALSNGVIYDLCFVITRDRYNELQTRDDPYYVCKASLLPHEIVVQDVLLTTLSQRDYSLQYSLNTMGLASYAKIGGVPYVLRNNVRKRELVFGIGRSILRSSRLGKAEEVIGFTVVFNSEGDYRLGNCTPTCSPQDYERELERMIIQTVNNIAGQDGFEEGEELVLTFHVYKTTGKREVRAVTNAIGKLVRYKIEFALLHVNDSHDFYLFNDNPRIVQEGTNEKHQNNASFLPERGLMVRIGPRECLLTLTGPSQYRGRGCPGPVRLTLDSASTFKDLEYLAEQVFKFTFMSWRNFNVTHQPVTIRYSELMTSLNSHLQEIGTWTTSNVQRLRMKRWFL